MIIKCSRCGKVIKDTFIRLESSIIINRITSNGLIEPCNNMKDSTAELLCGDCFNDYCDCLNSLNSKYGESALNTVVEIVDDIQYQEGMLNPKELASMVEIVDDEDIIYDTKQDN